MKIFQASFTEEALLECNKRLLDRKPNVLISFGILDRNFESFLVENRDKIGMIILDCGAWTLNNSPGETHISLNSYKSYLKSFGHLFDYYFNLDEDFEPTGFEVNIYNQKRLEDAGLKPVPVVHDLYGAEVEYYIENKYPIVAIGSKQAKNINHLSIVIGKFYKAGIKVHLFGNSSHKYLSNLPISYCDSSSWAQTGAFGNINYWNPQKKAIDKTDKIYVGEYQHSEDKRGKEFTTYEFKNELKKYLRDNLGITYSDLLGSNGALLKQIVNLYYYMELEKIVNAKHEQRGFVTE